MFKKISLLLTLVILILATSCAKEFQPEEVYYVKYVSSGFRSSYSYDISYAGENGKGGFATIKVRILRELSVLCQRGLVPNIALGALML